jgi:hypothetical protein
MSGLLHGNTPKPVSIQKRRFSELSGSQWPCLLERESSIIKYVEFKKIKIDLFFAAILGLKKS